MQNPDESELKRVYLKGGERYFIHTRTGALYALARKKRRGQQPLFNGNHVSSIYIQKRPRRSNRRVGTLRVSLYVNGQYVSISWALLVLATMKGPRGQAYYPHHRNGNINDCTPDNLEWKRNKRKASLWNVLTDDEYALWREKLESLGNDTKSVKEFNRVTWRRYLRASRMLSRKPQKREEFFRKLFAI